MKPTCIHKALPELVEDYTSYPNPDHKIKKCATGFIIRCHVVELQTSAVLLGLIRAALDLAQPKAPHRGQVAGDYQAVNCFSTSYEPFPLN